MRTLTARFRLILIHVLAWFGFATYEQAIVIFTNATRFDLSNTLLLYCLNAALFYCNSHLLLPRFYVSRHYVRYVSAAASVLVGYALLRSELNLIWTPVKVNEVVPFLQMWILALYRGSFFLFVSIGYWYAQSALHLATQQRVHEQQLRETERNLFEANLNFLKSQINPHFLFNSLNFLYAQIYPHSESAARAILLLSDTIRYALHEDNQNKVMLTQEIQHLKNYIALNQLRFHDQLQVQFECIGPLDFLLILPLVLITFVENCFKHGELTDAADPLVIRLKIVENELTFYTHNHKRLGPKEKSTGIGLANTRKRLDLMYPDRHELHIVDSPTHYTCTLTIAL